jgi:membrane associated rhomboid family serine protease
MFIPLRDENPTSRFSWMAVSIITLNCLIFFYQFLSPQGLQYFVLRMGAVPYEFSHGGAVSRLNRLPASLTLLTSMFLHGGFLHLAGNMLYLWIFGNNIEDFLGSFRFVLFYLLCGGGALGAKPFPKPAYHKKRNACFTYLWIDFLPGIL